MSLYDYQCKQRVTSCAVLVISRKSGEATGRVPAAVRTHEQV